MGVYCPTQTVVKFSLHDHSLKRIMICKRKIENWVQTKQVNNKKKTHGTELYFNKLLEGFVVFQYKESIVHIKYNKLERSKTCPYLLTHFLKRIT